MREEYISTVDQVNSLLFEQQFDKGIGRYRQLFLYRGLSNASYELVSSLQRCCQQDNEKMADIEMNLLDNFAKYAKMEHPDIDNSIWTKMIIGQHHGLPTRLMDWTRSPMIALHFAMTESNLEEMDRHNCVIWRLDVKKLHEKLPEKYREACRGSVFTIDSLGKVCSELTDYDRDIQDCKSMAILEPPTIDQRISNQYSFFSVVPSNVERVEDILTDCDDDTVVKYVIDRNLRWRIRDMLDEANVNERLIYPGLDGIAKWMNRHYYVRKLFRLSIVRTNIVDLPADVVVCPTDRSLEPRGDLANDIFRAAGSELNKECKKYRETFRKPGDIFSTDSFDLKKSGRIKQVYHAFGIDYREDQHEACVAELTQLYTKLLEQALKDGYQSIGFPLLCSGIKGFKQNDAWKCALSACLAFKEAHPDCPMTVSFCVIKENNFKTGSRIWTSLQKDANSESFHDEEKTEPQYSQAQLHPQRGAHSRHRRG